MKYMEKKSILQHDIIKIKNIAILLNCLLLVSPFFVQFSVGNTTEENFIFINDIQKDLDSSSYEDNFKSLSKGLASNPTNIELFSNSLTDDYID